MTNLEKVIVILAINIIVWIFVFWWIKRKTIMLQDIMRRSQESIIIGPEPGVFKGSSNRFGMLRSNGVIMLTEKMLIFKKLLGSEICIPVSDIIKVSKSAHFLGSSSSKNEYMILKLNDGTLIGLIVKDIGHWMRELSTGASSRQMPSLVFNTWIAGVDGLEDPETG